MQGNRGLPGERGDKGMKGRGGLAGMKYLLHKIKLSFKHFFFNIKFRISWHPRVIKTLN